LAGLFVSLPVVLRLATLRLNRDPPSGTVRFLVSGMMSFDRKDLETLRLLRAFVKITDPQKRREIVEMVEKLAPPKSDERTSS
jgi:hypothetical protein